MNKFILSFFFMFISSMSYASFTVINNEDVGFNEKNTAEELIFRGETDFGSIGKSKVIS